MPMNLIVFPIGGGGGGNCGPVAIGGAAADGVLTTGGGGGGGFGWNRNGFRSTSEGFGDGFFSASIRTSRSAGSTWFPRCAAGAGRRVGGVVETAGTASPPENIRDRRYPATAI